MNYNEVIKVVDTWLLPRVLELYELKGYVLNRIGAHEGGRNLVYNCEKDVADARILRFSFLEDRKLEDMLGEVEYIRYLYEHGGSVSNVISSKNGNLVEEIIHEDHSIFVCLFEKAKGKLLVENNLIFINIQNKLHKNIKEEHMTAMVLIHKVKQ